MIHPHTARALNDGLEDNGGNLVAMRGHQAGKRHHIVLVSSHRQSGYAAGANRFSGR
jgi:hypothetical protein